MTRSTSLVVSVIIVSFNTRDLLKRCLQTLADQAGAIPYETIVVDNASKDGSADMVQTEFPATKLIRSDVNLGFAGANNRGFEVASGKYIVLLNSDAFLCAEALPTAVEKMEVDPTIGLGGGRLLGSDDSWQPSARMFPSLLNDFLAISGLASRYPLSRFFGRSDRTWADPGEPAKVDWVPGAFSIIRREVLDRIGFFDKRFFLYYEEVDLCQRIQQGGYSIWYWPDVMVVHLGGESSKTVNHLHLTSTGSQLTLWRMRSGLLYYRKHHGRWGAWQARALETIWHRIRSWKNRVAGDQTRKEKAKEAQLLVSLMKKAWMETNGGMQSPTSPW
jgi:GT2 family glycosyltransferase